MNGARAGVSCILLWLLAMGCQREEPPEEEPASEPAVELPDPFEPGALGRVDERALASRADLAVSGAFAHAPHRDVACNVCHQSVAGHTSHPGVACRDCHAAPAPTAAFATVGESECLACHHVEQSMRDCAGCHATGPTDELSVVQHLSLSVWASPRDRALPFDHADHVDRACSTCHAEDARQTFDTECGACHEEHHGPTVQCSACHSTFPLETHDAGAHLGCGGTGCHVDPVGPVPDSRARCLACHSDQVDHEPGRECSQCHLLDEIVSGAAAMAGADRR